MKGTRGPLLSEDAQKMLLKDFSRLREHVKVLVFTDDRENKPFNDFSVGLMQEISNLSDKIHPEFEPVGGELALRYGVVRTPTLLIHPEKYRIRFTGAPAGEEARSLVMALLMASTGKTILSDLSRKRLADLKGQRSIKVFVSPTCPYCPQQTALAIAAAIEKESLISVEVIEIHENRDLAVQYNAFTVPQVFIDDRLVGMGLQPEEVFIEEIVSAAPVQSKPAEPSEKIEKDLLIIGAGPAGLTAAIYAERSGLRTVVVEKSNIGGQVSITPVVENYPGFTKIGGKSLMDMMAQQAAHYADVREGEEVLEIKRDGELFGAATTRTRYTTKAVLFASGAESRKLNVPGETLFQGKGISYCAACDGYFFKDGKKVFVIGGGNSAATEALYLKNIGADVTLVHRRDSLRAELELQKNLAEQNIPILFNSVVIEIKGDRLVSDIVIKNTVDQAIKMLHADGIFIAIGYVPSSELAKKSGVDTDEQGYIRVDARQRTSIPGIYAAGDITGGIKQIVTAVSQGAVAAMTIFEDIAHPYWKGEQQ